ncbi:MAG: MetQ/NlpA family ABC transporter substrate-binding protein [Microbacteriaceae bacterium]
MARKTIRTAITSLAVLALAGGALTACSSDSSDPSDKGGDQKTVRLGVVGAADPYWAEYEKAVEEELDIDLKIVDFGEYNLPNPALEAGDLDINQFQHIIFLAEHNAATGDDLTPIGSTAIYPLSVHSQKYKSIDEIPKGEKIAVPNDPSNKARALLVLQQAGLIKLKDGGNTGSTLDDVLTDESKVTVTEFDAALTASVLNDVAAAVVNNDFVEKAGLDFNDALFLDDPNDPSSLPYVNIFAVRADDADNELYKQLVEIYHNTAAVTDGVQDVSGGTAVITNTPAADLQKALEKQLEIVKASE